MFIGAVCNVEELGVCLCACSDVSLVACTEHVIFVYWSIGIATTRTTTLLYVLAVVVVVVVVLIVLAV
jgi:hypothetical protein